MFAAAMITGSDGTYTGSSPGGVGGYGAYSYSYSVPAGAVAPSGGSGTFTSGTPTSAESGGSSGGGTMYGGYAPATPGAPGGAPAGFSLFGPFGERGPYTELRYPEMRFLRAGENPTELLNSLRAQKITGGITPMGWGVLALILIAMLKGK